MRAGFIMFTSRPCLLTSLRHRIPTLTDSQSEAVRQEDFSIKTLTQEHRSAGAQERRSDAFRLMLFMLSSGVVGRKANAQREDQC